MIIKPRHLEESIEVEIGSTLAIHNVNRHGRAKRVPSLIAVRVVKIGRRWIGLSINDNDEVDYQVDSDGYFNDEMSHNTIYASQEQFVGIHTSKKLMFKVSERMSRFGGTGAYPLETMKEVCKLLNIEEE